MLCISDAVEAVTFPAAPASGVNRIDSPIVQVHDAVIDAGSANGFTFDIVSGSTSSSPSFPVIPARAELLATVSAIGGQANIAQANIVPVYARDTGWQPAAFLNGWGGSAAYRRIVNAVYLAGTLNSGVSGTVAFNLPNGFRPARRAAAI